MHRYYIHVSLAEQDKLLSGGSGIIKPIKVPALVKQLRLRRIQVFGFSVSHDAAAKTDHPVIDIHNRKHDAVPELVP